MSSNTLSNAVITLINGIFIFILICCSMYYYFKGNKLAAIFMLQLATFLRVAQVSEHLRGISKKMRKWL